MSAFFNPVWIDENACQGCGDCYEHFSCPAIGRRVDRKAFIIVDLCNGNGSCIQVCPKQAIKRQPVPPGAVVTLPTPQTADAPVAVCEPGGGA
jgi:TPP-dependent indolepyruvate ferredoxin oxidoreductase alpha subunit